MSEELRDLVYEAMRPRAPGDERGTRHPVEAVMDGLYPILDYIEKLEARIKELEK